MKIKILRNTKINGKPVKKGQVVEANKTDAKLLINIKKAVVHTTKNQAKKDV